MKSKYSHKFSIYEEFTFHHCLDLQVELETFSEGEVAQLDQWDAVS